jgi:hypothetical protein
MITGSDPVSQANLSVGMALYANASDAMFLYKQIGTRPQLTRIYIIKAKGRFQPLYPNNPTGDTDGYPSFANERAFLGRCTDLDIRVPQAEARSEETTGVQIGTSVDSMGAPELVIADIESLIATPIVSESDLDLILAPNTFREIALATRTQGLSQRMRSFLERQRPGTIYVDLRDENGARNLVAELASPARRAGEEDTRHVVTELASSIRSTEQGPRAATLRRLREAHARNRATYSAHVEHAINAANARNRAIDAAEDHLDFVENSSYSVEILSHSPASIFNTPRVSSRAVSPVQVIELDFDSPSYRTDCEICCEEDAIMSLAVKELDHLTTALIICSQDGFAYPLWAGSTMADRNPLSSQVICYDCAKALMPRSIYREQLSAVIPVMKYSMCNKMVINRALYDGLTRGSDVGEAQIAQIAMAVLDKSMNHSWVKEHEGKKGAIEWLLNSLLKHTVVPAKFTPGSERIQFPEALQWIVRDCGRNGLQSYSAQYPLSGFLRIISLGLTSKAISWQGATVLTEVKALYEIIETFLKADAANDSGDRRWQVPWTSITSQSSPESFWTGIGKLVDLGDLLHTWKSSLSHDFILRARTIIFLLLNFQNRHSTVREFVDHIRNVGLALVDRTVSLEGSWSALDATRRPSSVESEIIEERVVLMAAPSSRAPQAMEVEEYSPRPFLLARSNSSERPSIAPVEVPAIPGAPHASERSFTDSSAFEEERASETDEIYGHPRLERQLSGYEVLEGSTAEDSSREEE